MHFAAFAYVGESVTDPALYYNNNVRGTLSLLDGMLAAGATRLVFSSTCATYGLPDAVPIVETMPQRPVNPYGETKLAIERVLHWYGAAYGLRSVALRYFNAAGCDRGGEIGEEHDPETHLIPLVLRAALGFGRRWSWRDYQCGPASHYIMSMFAARVRPRHLDGAALPPRQSGDGRGYSVREVIAAVARRSAAPCPPRDAASTGDPPALIADPACPPRLRAESSDLETIIRTRWPGRCGSTTPRAVPGNEPRVRSLCDGCRRPFFAPGGRCAVSRRGDRMRLVVEHDVAEAPRTPPRVGAVRVDGKFFRAGPAADAPKHFIKGVTYGPFALGSHGAQFPERDMVERDFALMVTAGINTVRVFTVPPVWLLDAAHGHGLKMLVGLPWSQHVAFLDSAEIQAGIRDAIVAGVRACARHEAVLAYLVGNEIPPDVIRWHGAGRVAKFVESLAALVRREHPSALVSYASFPSTEYLNVADFCDFLCFNVYLHDETAFRRYVARLHNLTVTKPLVRLSSSADSLRSSEEEQRCILSWHIRAAFAGGAAGTFVFAWTDEWFTGGHPIEDWDFGLVDRQRKPKPAFAEVKAQYLGQLPPALPRYPRASVVVCAYNAERTMDKCLASLEKLNYPDYEVIVVNDGSRDRTLAISESYPYCRIISQENKGLSVARNVGAEAATGEIVAIPTATASPTPTGSTTWSGR